MPSSKDATVVFDGDRIVAAGPERIGEGAERRHAHRRQRPLAHSGHDRRPRPLFPIGKSVHASRRRRFQCGDAVCEGSRAQQGAAVGGVQGVARQRRDQRRSMSAARSGISTCATIAAKTAAAPRVEVAGPLISMVARPQLELDGDPPIIKIDSPQAARDLVARELKRKPDFIKVWYIHQKGDDFAAQEAIVKADGGRRARRAHASGRARDGTRRREIGAARRRGLSRAFGRRRADRRRIHRAAEKESRHRMPDAVRLHRLPSGAVEHVEADAGRTAHRRSADRRVDARPRHHSRRQASADRRCA